VPAIGLQTLKELIHSKASAFAFEAEKTLFLDQADFIEQADQKGIALVGVSDSQ
jgi:DUF1009 family protein